MVVAAHPDDEILGLGGTMHKLITESKNIIRVVVLGEGITSRSDKHNTEIWKKELEIHGSNMSSAQKKIGYHDIKCYNFPDNRFDTVALLDIVKTIEKEKNEFLPDIIFTHHGGDLNIDHQRTFEAVITATRPLSLEVVKAIITFETMSGTEWRASTDPRNFIPNLFFEIAEGDLNAKIAAMECYEFEKREYPHPRSPEALRIVAQRWGVVIGKKYAEAFCLVRALS